MECPVQHIQMALGTGGHQVPVNLGARSCKPYAFDVTTEVVLHVQVLKKLEQEEPHYWPLYGVTSVCARY